MILPIYSLLSESTEVLKLVGDRIFEDIVQCNANPPYIVWQELSADPLHNLDQPAKTDHIMYQVMCYDANQTKAYELRDAVRKVLEQHSHILNARISHQDYGTKLFVRGFDANWFLER